MTIFGIISLGSCSSCEGAVNSMNGSQLQCDHPIHYTCLRVLRNEFRGLQISNSDMICQICVSSRLNTPETETNEGLRKRPSGTLKGCVNCGKGIVDDERTLACGHQVHESCWTRMEETSMTTCPACMDY